MSNDNENDTNTGSPDLKRNYWYWAPGGNKDDHWKEFYEAGIMAIGWDELGDLSRYHDKTEIAKKLREHNGLNRPRSASMAWNFYHTLKPGDIVFAKRGMKRIIGRGVVTGDYKFDKGRECYKHTRKVEWKLCPGGEAINLPNNAPQDTLFEIKEEKDQKLLEALFNGTTVAP